jgi:HSP20 family protein
MLGKEHIMKTKTLPDKLRINDPFVARFGDNPFAFLRRMAPTFDRFFDELPWHAESRLPAFETANWLPNVDIFERDGMFVVRADLPGMTKDNVKVEIKKNVISIEGERKTDFEEDKDGVYRMERAYGTFFRAIPLPEGARTEAVKASFKDGVLEVTAPLPPAKTEPTSKSVEIQER